jgi:DNA polymerase phi
VFEDVDEQHAEGDDSSEEASDVEMIDGTNGTTGHNLPTDDTSSVSSDSDNSSSDADNNSDPELAEFNAKLAQALGTKPLDQNLSADVDESSDEDMNDEQMEALDAQLETVFKERKKAKVTKNERKEAKETVVLFKSRVLELLEIYIKQEYLNPLALEIIFPLIRLIRTTSSKQVSEKASTILREYSRLYKMKDKLSRDPVAPDYIKGLLEGIHAAAMLEGSNAYGTACSQASLLVSKILIANGHDPEEVVAQYAETQKKFLLDSNCHVRTAFFSDWLNWCTSARKNLAAVRGGKANEA